MDDHKTCDICQGSGEVSYFKGVSRFLLSQEVCPACNGAGLVVDEKNNRAESMAKGKESKSNDV